MNIYKDRIKQLLERMEKYGIDYYIVPTADFHNSEYVNDYFKAREYLSGFTGSNGTLVVSRHETGLWTDGRYFVQAERELDGSEIVLYRMAEEGVPTVEEYLDIHVNEHEKVGFFGMITDAAFGIQMENSFKEKNLIYDIDLVGEIWQNRPLLPDGEVWIVPENLCGMSVSDKLVQIRAKMQQEKAEYLLITSLDDIMWLYNIRGNDIACTPVALSYTFITKAEAVLFLQDKVLTKELEVYLKENNVVFKSYNKILSFISEYNFKGNIWCDRKQVNYSIYKLLESQGSIIDKPNPTALLKAVKNKTELENLRDFYVRDSVVLTRFLFWIKENVGRQELDEYSMAVKLDEMRSQIQGFQGLSFETISAYGENAAMMHYTATKDNSAKIKPEGLYLVDSGAQYMGATTDVTRTIALGKITDEMKMHFTKAVSGMLRLADTKFIYGCTGRNIDIVARQPLWDCYIDYKCGTGHGIGYILNVHEGPQNIRWRYNPKVEEAVLEEGMIVSDEPGVYIEGSHGIRIENILEVVKEKKNSDGQFMGFRHLTYVPIDLDAIDVNYMEKTDIEKLNQYHACVRKVLEPYFTGDELDKLLRATRSIEK